MQQNTINPSTETNTEPKVKIRKKYTWDMILMMLLTAGVLIASIFFCLSWTEGFFVSQVGMVRDVLSIVTGIPLGLLLGIIPCVLLWTLYAIVLCILNSVISAFRK